MYCCGFLSTKGKTRKTLTKLEVHDYTVKLNIANSAICGILIAPNERFGVKQRQTFRFLDERLSRIIEILIFRKMGRPGLATLR